MDKRVELLKHEREGENAKREKEKEEKKTKWRKFISS